MAKEIIHTDAAPAAVGPYSQATAVSGGRTVYLSGQIGLEPGTGELVSENFEGQVRQAFANLTAVIEAAGGTLDDIVKLTLFLTDLSKFGSVNAIMADLIPQPYPARSTIGVATLPKGALFEVEAIIVTCAAGMAKRSMNQASAAKSAQADAGANQIERELQRLGL